MALTFHPLFTDHGVLQRGRPIPVWGWATPGAVVMVTCAGVSASASADADGRWLVRLPALPAGGPHTLTATADDTARTEVRDVLIGDVFLASGQSNMEWPLAETTDAAATIAASTDAKLRLFAVPRRTALEPQPSVEARWTVCGPATVPSFSAVAYHAGAALRQAHPEVPVGLINASWCGTAVEPWISVEGLALFPEPWLARQQLVDLEALRTRDPTAHQARLAGIRADFEDLFVRWRQAILDADGGETAGYHQPGCALAGWQDYPVPSFWPNAIISNHEGVVWFACDVEVPPGLAGRDALLHLGSVDNEDTTWWNGQFVGGIDMRDGPEHWNLQRRHAVPGHLVKAGANRLVVRVMDYGGRGGFGGAPEGNRVEIGQTSLPLPATWRCRIGSRLAGARPAYPPALGGSQIVGPGCPGALFAGMIAPLVPASLAGILWYQGESNADRAESYRTLFPGLIADWRRWFRPEPGAAPLPFVWVQLTAWRQPPEHHQDRPGAAPGGPRRSGPSTPDPTRFTAPVGGGWPPVPPVPALAPRPDGRAAGRESSAEPG